MGYFKWIAIIIGCSILAIVLYVYLRADEFVASLIRKSLPDHIELNHGQISTNIFNGSVDIKDVNLVLMNKIDSIEYAFVQMQSMELKRFSYWQYLVNDKIKVKSIVFRDPIATIYPSLIMKEIDSLQQEQRPIKQNMLLDKFEIINGQVRVMSDNLDSIKLSIETVDFQITMVETDPQIQLEKIPINYDEIKLNINELAFTMSMYEKLFIQQASINKTSAEITDLVINSVYSKQRMLSILPEEREHLSVKLPSIVLDSIDYGYKNDVFSFYARDMQIQEADIVVHLDKRLKDRTKIKPMYSKLIRELPFALQIDTTRIENSRVVYEEKHEEGIPAGIVKFDALNVQIFDLSNNSKPGLKTNVYANALIMGKSPASIDWSFDIQNQNDYFSLSGKASDFDASSVNKFLNSFYKASLSGHVDQVYFTVAGNDKHSKGDFKMKYRDLKIEIQKDDRSKKNWIKSFVGNAIMNSGKDGDAEGFRHSQISIDRNQHKPFFNFLWLNVKDGALKAIQKNNKRKDSKDS